MSDLVAATRSWIKAIREDAADTDTDTDERKVRRVGGLGVAFVPSEDTGTEAVELPDELILGVSKNG